MPIDEAGGAPGPGGGGAGAPGPTPIHGPNGVNGQAGTVNTGGGGGGAKVNCSGTGGAGGSGVVVVRVPASYTLAGSPCGATTLSTAPNGDKIAKFTADATLTIG